MALAVQRESCDRNFYKLAIKWRIFVNVGYSVYILGTIYPGYAMLALFVCWLLNCKLTHDKAPHHIHYYDVTVIMMILHE